MEIPKPKSVSYTWTDSIDTFHEWTADLESNHPLIALDFEAATKYSDSDLAEIRTTLESGPLDFYETLELKSVLNSTALSHPIHSYPTHLSIGLSDIQSRVVLIPTWEMLNAVTEWLTTTNICQIWHNASYDFKHIYFHTNKFPKNYEDSSILAKSILNHVETYQAKVGLKELAGPHYGNWAISADNFNASQMYDEHVIHYAAIDSAATFWLWNSMTTYLKEQSDE